MDDKTLIAQYAAGEMLRINERLKNLIESGGASEEMRDSVVFDIETTLSRLQRALSFVKENEIEAEDIYNFEEDEIDE